MKLVLVCNRVAGGWSPLESNGWGGGEEVLTNFARALARASQDVTVLYDGPACEEAGVHYLPRTTPDVTAETAIFFKSPEEVPYHPGIAPKKLLLSDQDRVADLSPFDLIVPCSQTLSRYFRSQMPQTAEKLFPIPYGYEPSAFPEPPVERDANLVLHASSPDRGLESLLQLWPRVLERRPHTKLLCSYGWDLFQKYGGDPRLKARLEVLLAALPSDAVEFRRLSHDEIHAAFQRAAVWAYYFTPRGSPPVGEMFCLTAVKAQIAGAVPVVRKVGVLQETVWNGLEGNTPETFAAAVVEALEKQDDLRDRMDTERAHTWDDVARRWLDLLQDVPVRVSSSKLVQMPGTPNLDPKPTDNAPGLLANVIVQWLQEQKSTVPMVPPGIGIQLFRDNQPMPNAAKAKDADAVAFAWELEDADCSATETIAATNIKPGTPVLILTSYGPWRAGQRKRLLLRHDLMELFGQQPDFNLRTMPLDAEGNGLTATSFRYVSGRVGRRDVQRVRRRTTPSEGLAVCVIVRNGEKQLLRMLRSLTDAADEIILVDTGSDDATAALVERFNLTTSGPRVQFFTDGVSPRYCWDCAVEHGVGDTQFGHRLAGFEYPRNQSISHATAPWVLWLDADEELLQARQLPKYLKKSLFEGYAIAQHHFTVEPPGGAMKIDTPVRLFRRTSDGSAPGVVKYGPHAWPTFHPGLTCRFSGIVHEHPGKGLAHAELGLTYYDGIPLAVGISDVWIAHSGYYTEIGRRGRFMRNWPLMVSDQLKYPDRRLGMFLLLRDLSHHLQYVVQKAGNRLTPEAAQYCEECIRLWQTHFRTGADPFSVDALDFVTKAYRVLNQGLEVDLPLKVWKPEVSGEEAESPRIVGRLADPAEILMVVKARLQGTDRWVGRYL